MRFLKLTSATLTIAGVLGACSDNAAPARAGETIVASTTTVRPDDGELLIGAILPRDGVAAELGSSMNDALSLALSEINEAGGVGGMPVRMIQREEGDNEATASLATLELIELGVDAIIGPTSSTNTLATLGTAVDAGVLTCSPSATALALDAFPDNGLFIRTIASDSLQAQALASLVESSGTSSAVIVYVDDNYGRPFALETRLAVLTEGTSVTAMVPFNASEGSIAAAVDDVVATQAEVVVVIADGTTGPAIITAIDDASIVAPTYVVNDAVRRPATSAQPFGRSLRVRIEGVSPLAYPTSDSFVESLRSINPSTTGLFAQNAYDCLNAIALAALAAESDQPAKIVRQIPIVTDQGTPCSNFAACAESLADGRQIDYSGPGRDLTIGSDGEVTTAFFERFTFDTDGRDVAAGLVTVGR
ncbi:MAG: ABC transporter substrate-binding protein [Actinomycetia bacterium]|nr:ABC transporter substrate-binding protein [Actinomycetes bacterium]